MKRAFQRRRPFRAACREISLAFPMSRSEKRLWPSDVRGNNKIHYSRSQISGKNGMSDVAFFHNALTQAALFSSSSRRMHNRRFYRCSTIFNSILRARMEALQEADSTREHANIEMNFRPKKL